MNDLYSFADDDINKSKFVAILLRYKDKSSFIIPF